MQRIGTNSRKQKIGRNSTNRKGSVGTVESVATEDRYEQRIGGNSRISRNRGSLGTVGSIGTVGSVGTEDW